MSSPDLTSVMLNGKKCYRVTVTGDFFLTADEMVRYGTTLSPYMELAVPDEPEETIPCDTWTISPDVLQELKADLGPDSPVLQAVSVPGGTA